MTTFTIDEQNNISAFSTPEEAAAATATPFDSFSSQRELAELAKDWPAERLVAIFNSLTGVTPVESFKSNKAAVSRIWKRIQSLAAPEQQPEQTAKPKADKKAKGGAQSPKRAPAKAKATKKAAKAKEGGAPREGSKTAQVIAMLQRKGGASLSAIMKAMKWQKHTTRAFVSATLGKKLGLAVESFKPEGGERSYRIK